MGINWKLRFKNKTTLVSLVTVLISFIYQAAAFTGLSPRISENEFINIALLLINALASLGIIIDPTTQGLLDSEQALTYDKPKGNESEEK